MHNAHILLFVCSSHSQFAAQNTVRCEYLRLRSLWTVRITHNTHIMDCVAYYACAHRHTTTSIEWIRLKQDKSVTGSQLSDTLTRFLRESMTNISVWWCCALRCSRCRCSRPSTSTTVRLCGACCHSSTIGQVRRMTIFEYQKNAHKSLYGKKLFIYKFAVWTQKCDFYTSHVVPLNGSTFSLISLNVPAFVCVLVLCSIRWYLTELNDWKSDTHRTTQRNRRKMLRRSIFFFGRKLTANSKPYNEGHFVMWSSFFIQLINL